MRSKNKGISRGVNRDLHVYVDFPWDASACMGTGAYSETMVRALAQANPDSTITLIVPLGSPRRIQLANVNYTSLPATEGLSEGTRQISLPAYLDAVKADCLFAPASLLPAVKVCPMVATVHDLTFETHADLYAPALADYLRRWFPSTLSGADRIVAISEPVKQDLLFRKRVAPEKVSVIEQPIRQTFFEPLSQDQVDAELRAIGVLPPFFFHVSNLSAHKNMTFGVRVFAEFLRLHPAATQDLLFAGGGFSPSAPPDLLAIARDLGIGQRVKYVGKVSDASLKALYQRCDAFLFPSLIEGWGLPVVEARTLGAKVLSSPNVPSAKPEERLPLEAERWITALQGSQTAQDRGGPPQAMDAGKRLAEVIREAIASYRSGILPVPDDGRERGQEKASRGLPVVAIRGDWHSPSGFGQAARGTFRALESAGLNPVAAAVPKDSIQNKHLWRGEVSLRRDTSDLWIHHLPPEHFDLTLEGKHASFVFWETDRLPTNNGGRPWSEILSDLDEIWSPSSFVTGVLEKNGVKAPVFQVSPAVDTELFCPGPRRDPEIDLPPGFDPTWTVFLFVGTWDSRKRADLMV